MRSSSQRSTPPDVENSRGFTRSSLAFFTLLLLMIWCPEPASAGHLFADDESIYAQLGAGQGALVTMDDFPDDPSETDDFILFLDFSTKGGGPPDEFSTGDIVRFTLNGCSLVFDFDSPVAGVSQGAHRIAISIPPGGPCFAAYDDQLIVNNTATFEVLSGEVRFTGLSLDDASLPSRKLITGQDFTLGDTFSCGDSQQGLQVGPFAPEQEACDDGNSSDYDTCTNSCEIASCGDGFPQPGEECDDGGTQSGDGCSATCTNEVAPSCGDGIPQLGEECDDANASNEDACLNTCTLASCQDSFVHSGVEECDDGNSQDGDGCSSSCVLEFCGDGIVNDVNENCDDANSSDLDGCSSSCQQESGWTCSGEPSTCNTLCGDGIIAGNETCDDGGTSSQDGCSSSCTLESGWTCVGEPSSCSSTCGDSIQVGGETCDDGNTQDNDGCSSSCVLEICGDGVINNGSETCDDGNPDDGDGCSSSCQTEAGWSCSNTPSVCNTTCGDGIVAGSEPCDDGNSSNNDACLNGCVPASCGDGFLWNGTEECDDGANPIFCDGCDGATCTATIIASSAQCGDFIVQFCEECDDGNQNACDGCSPACHPEPIPCESGDWDFDGYFDSDDNCPYMPNELQENNDADAAGDACDNDDDNDTVLDSFDNCPLVSNRLQANFDLDSLGDICDPDDDNDSLLDIVETNTNEYVNASDTGTDPFDSDSDDDGVSDGDEVAAGTNPNVADSGVALPAIGPLGLSLLLGLLALTATRAARRARGGAS